MATFIVTTANDVVAGDGLRSLREAVSSANATPEADVIRFAPALEGHTLTLTQGELRLTRDVTIDGDADNNGSRVEISGGWSGNLDERDGSGILNLVGAGTDVSLVDLALSHGSAADGGAVHVGGGRLSLSGSSIHDSLSFTDGGAIFAAAGSRVTLADSEITNNGAYDLGGGIYLGPSGSLTVERSQVEGNVSLEFGAGGGIVIQDGTATVSNSLVASNGAYFSGGGIEVRGGSIAITNSTLADNDATYGASGLYLRNGASALIRESTITDNIGGGVGGDRISANHVELFDSIVAGNIYRDAFTPVTASDVDGPIAFSNGHNLFGSEVAGAVSGDRLNVAGASLFVATDPLTGGGQLDADGSVPLRASIANPALSGGDRFAAMPTDQLGHARPQPTGGLPDIGATELSQTLSTRASANNDVLTGTSAANTISGLDGADRINGAGGNDTLSGGNGSDLLEGGTGNDKLYGGSGIDIAYYGGSTAVLFDLSGSTDTARRGSETDTLSSIQGVIGSSAGDTFRGDGAANLFMGGDGKDTYTGGGGRDLYDFNALSDSRVGFSARDVITDFAHGTDKIDLSGIDADTTRPGDQAFHWVGNAPFTGAPGELGFFTSGANTVIQASNDGDTAGELQIQLTGHPALSASDFYL